GGWRISQLVAAPEIRFLAGGMKDKADLLKIKKEGGKSGVVADAESMPLAQQLDVARGFADCFRDLMGTRYVAATDIGSNAKHMAAMAQMVGTRCMTGLPLE